MKKEPIFTGVFICVFMAQFCCALVMYMLMTTIGEYVTASGATAAVAGAVSGMYVFGGLFSRVCSGTLLNKYSWKKVAMAFLLLHFAASLGYFLADNIAVLIVIRFIHGIGFGASANAIMVIGMASLPKSRYGEATGYFMLSTSLGIAVGPYIGGLVYDSFGGTGSFAGASICSFLCVFFMAFVKSSGGGEKKAEGDKPEGIRALIEPSAVPISLCILCLSFGYAALISFYRMYAGEVGLVKEFSYFFLIYAAVLIVSRLVAGSIQDRFGDDVVCYPSFILQAIGLFLIAFRPSMVSIVICAVATALGYGTMNSCLNAILNRNISDERRPFAVTTYWACCDLAVGIGPILLGMIISLAGYAAMYYVAAALALVAIPVYYGATSDKR